jgi:DNA-binding transcriptional LysR family regulator
MDRLEAMAILVKVAETGSFTGAARALNTPLPSVSRKISELEAHLGARLLTRSTRRLAITEAGAAYIAAARRILEDIDAAERSASGEFQTPRGELTIAAPIVFGRLHVAPVVAEFLRSFPDISVRLALSDRNADLLADQIDVALRIGALADSSLLARRVGEVRQVCCASPDYLARRGAPDTPEDLARHDGVAFGVFDQRTAWTFGRRGEFSAQPRVRLSVNTAEAALDAALAGVGITRALSYQAAQALRQGGLVRLLQAFEPEPIPVHLLFDGSGPTPLKLRSFLDFAAPRLSALLAAAAL